MRKGRCAPALALSVLETLKTQVWPVCRFVTPSGKSRLEVSANGLDKDFFKIGVCVALLRNILADPSTLYSMTVSHYM